MYTLARAFAEAQQTIDRRSVQLERELLEMDTPQGSLPDHVFDVRSKPVRFEKGALSAAHMTSRKKYRITELLLEVPVVADVDVPTGQGRFRIAPAHPLTWQGEFAHIKVSGAQRICAEFEVAGEVRATLVLA